MDKFGTNGNKWGPCRHAIDLQNKSAQVGKKGITLHTYMVMLAWFKKAHGQLKFKYDHSNWKWTVLDSIFSMVTMSFNSNTNLYSLDLVDVAFLNEFVAKSESSHNLNILCYFESCRPNDLSRCM